VCSVIHVDTGNRLDNIRKNKMSKGQFLVASLTVNALSLFIHTQFVELLS
jgi:hypothetical protein